MLLGTTLFPHSLSFLGKSCTLWKLLVAEPKLPYIIFNRTFCRQKFKAHFLNGAPHGSAGSANKSGWMCEAEFEGFLKHFIKHVRPGPDFPVLLLLDNHCSHLSVNALELARSNCITMLSFPPHCSHKLQPLDISVNGPLKRYVNYYLFNGYSFS